MINYSIPFSQDRIDLNLGLNFRSHTSAFPLSCAVFPLVLKLGGVIGEANSMMCQVLSLLGYSVLFKFIVDGLNEDVLTVLTVS